MSPVCGIFAAFILLPLASCTCGSYGTDFVDGGTYCVDTSSDDFFSFGTAFWDCFQNDTQGGVDPILVDPNNEDYICSTIQTNPDDVPMLSTCNVPGEEVRKSHMISGTYIAVIEGLTFAYARAFSIIAGIPVVVTSTPTISFTITTTPMTTTTSPLTSIMLTTLPASTTTIPATTNTQKTTISPKPTTTTLTTTKTITLRNWLPKITKTTTIKTITTPCRTATRRNDPTCTIHPPKASLAAAADYAPRGLRNGLHHHGVKPLHGRRVPLAANLELLRRSPDLCTTTILATTEVTSTAISTAPTSTVTSTVVVLRTETM